MMGRARHLRRQFEYKRRLLAFQMSPLDQGESQKPSSILLAPLQICQAQFFFFFSSICFFRLYILPHSGEE